MKLFKCLRRHGNIITGGCAASFSGLALAGCVTAEKQSESPNIIFLLADDMRWDAFGYAGNPYILTPNMDSLAANGVYFPNTYATTSISCVSRASIMTGQHMAAHGIADFAGNFTEDQLDHTFPSMLREAGYYTGFIGKYGIGPNDEFPVDRYDFWRSFPGQGWYWKDGITGNGEHLTAVQGGQIREFISSRDKDKPFCLLVSFKAPHCQDDMRRRGGEEFPPDPRDEALYEGVVFPLPETRDDGYYTASPEAFRRSSSGVENEGRVRWRHRFADDEMYRKTVGNYYRLVSGVDREIGLMMEQLRREGIDGNTVVMLMGDNGFYLAEHGLAGKWFAHEESVRLPLFIHDPRLPKSRHGIKPEGIALNIDVAPTILSLAGVPAPERMQGRDLAGLIDGNDSEWRKSFYYEHTYSQGVYLPCSEAVIGGKYKLVRYFAEGNEWYELYDVAEDPYEKINLSGDPAYKEIMYELTKEMNALKQDAYNP